MTKLRESVKRASAAGGTPRQAYAEGRIRLGKSTGGARPTRMMRRRRGASDFQAVQDEPTRRLDRNQAGQQRAIEEVDADRARQHVELTGPDIGAQNRRSAGVSP